MSEDSVGSSAATAASVSMNTASIGNYSVVHIVCVRSHREFYVRSVETSEEHAVLIEEIQRASMVQPKLKFYPKRDDVVLAPFDGLYYRGRVVSLNRVDAMVKVEFIDFGDMVNFLLN